MLQHLIIHFSLYYLSSGRLREAENKRKFQKKYVYIGFRATLKFWKFKVAEKFAKSCVLSCL